MKSIAVVSDSKFKNDRKSSVGKVIANNLNTIFEEYVQINNYYIDEMNPSDSINDDLIFVMAGSRAKKIRDYVSNPGNIFIPRRTFTKKGLEPIFKLKKETDILVVNDDIETTLECVTTLYNICGKLVNLIPFIEGNNYTEINYAVTPSESEFVPSYIPNVIDLGTRVVDISTLLLIISKLQLNERSIHSRLYNYHQQVYSNNQGIEEHYNQLLARTEELDHLLDLSHDGILLTSKDGKILIYNQTFKQIFDIEEDLTDKYLHDCFTNIDFRTFYENDAYDDLIQFKHKFINLQKKDIVHYNEEIKMYFSFQEVTYIKKLEQNLTSKLRQKGQVARYTFEDIQSQSHEISMLIERSKRIATSDLTVLITGESGTGKEVLAQAIHNASPRSKQPFIAINAAAIPENLLESELFGYTKGSFTGALKEGKTGIFERANNGTIFLDEIGDMPFHLQSKLLRVLQEKQIAPIGSDNVIDVDVRIIAATHKKPVEMVESGKFRKDLFYRLNVFPLELPPLRERIEDIPLLLNFFTNHAYTLSKSCLDILATYEWPGNIRELINVAHYITTIDESKTVTPENLPKYITDASLIGSKKTNPDHKRTLTNREKVYLEAKLEIKWVLIILQVIIDLNEFNRTAGRKHILEIVNKSHSDMTESKLRRYLKVMSDIELIDAQIGRVGNLITSKGIALIAEFSL